MPQITEEDLEKMSPEQIAELQKQNCPFCLITSGKIPAKKVYEDEKCLAVLDINPANIGHIILFPKNHVMLMPQLGDELIEHLSVIAKKMSNVLLKAYKDKKVEGTNVFIANGGAAGQKAPHFMIHIIPRIEKDDVKAFTLPKHQMSDSDLTALQRLLALGEIKERPVQTAQEIKKEISPIKPSAQTPSLTNTSPKGISLKEIEEMETELISASKPTKAKTDLNTISKLLNSSDVSDEDISETLEKTKKKTDTQTKKNNETPKSEKKEPDKKEETKKNKNEQDIDLDSIARLLGK